MNELSFSQKLQIIKLLNETLSISPRAISKGQQQGSQYLRSEAQAGFTPFWKIFCCLFLYQTGAQMQVDPYLEQLNRLLQLIHPPAVWPWVWPNIITPWSHNEYQGLGSWEVLHETTRTQLVKFATCTPTQRLYSKIRAQELNWVLLLPWE